MEYKWTTLTVTALGALMAGLDGRIVVIGLPSIARQLHAGAEEVVWITESYLLASTICLLFIGRISDIFGRVKVYNIGFVIFTVGSALSAISLNSYQLIGFRIIQGFGAAILVSNSSAIITDASPKNELGTMLGINQTSLRVGNVAGLTLSGLVLSIVDWRGLFYVNIPIGIIGTIWAHPAP
jgi:MFS family permease